MATIKEILMKIKIKLKRPRWPFLILAAIGLFWVIYYELWYYWPLIIYYSIF